MTWVVVMCAAVLGTPAVPGVPASVYGNRQWVEANYSNGAVDPPKPVIPDELSVHVSISSYRDELCGRTLFELFNYAKNPLLITVGIVEQFLEGDMRCLEGYCKLMNESRNTCPYQDRIKIIKMTAGEAQGPMHARSFGGKLIQDENFCMQIDSHIRAIQDWDTKMISEWESAGNEYAVLSTYVQKEEDMVSRDYGSDINKWREVPMMCSTVSGMYGMVRNNQASAARALTRPLRSCFWGAGLSFSKCHMEKSVLHDPYSRGVFDGEEFTRAIRMWTHGYDMYVPSRGIIFHDYTKAQRSPKKWSSVAKHSNIERADPAIAYARLKGLLGMGGGSTDDLGEYGFGTRRTKAQYEKLCGLELSRSPRNFEEGKDRCGRLPWVPWDVPQKSTDDVHHDDSSKVQVQANVQVQVVHDVHHEDHEVQVHDGVGDHVKKPIGPPHLHMKEIAVILLVIVFVLSRMNNRGMFRRRVRND